MVAMGGVHLGALLARMRTGQWRRSVRSPGALVPGRELDKPGFGRRSVLA